jgi:hypothetical protein
MDTKPSVVPSGPLSPTEIPVDAKESLDPGAFIGHEPELAVETIPGGVRPDDVRVSAFGSQSNGVANQGEVPLEERGWPEGHREAHHVTDDDVREAGLNR